MHAALPRRSAYGAAKCGEVLAALPGAAKCSAGRPGGSKKVSSSASTLPRSIRSNPSISSDPPSPPWQPENYSSVISVPPCDPSAILRCSVL